MKVHEWRVSPIRDRGSWLPVEGMIKLSTNKMVSLFLFNNLTIFWDNRDMNEISCQESQE